jgi:hypothetical protein
VEKQLQLEPISSLDAGSQLASRPGRITPSESHAVTKPLAVSVFPRDALGDREKRNVSCYSLDRNMIPWSSETYAELTPAELSQLMSVLIVMA